MSWQIEEGITLAPSALTGNLPLVIILVCRSVSVVPEDVIYFDGRFRWGKMISVTK